MADLRMAYDVKPSFSYLNSRMNPLADFSPISDIFLTEEKSVKLSNNLVIRLISVPNARQSPSFEHTFLR